MAKFDSFMQQDRNPFVVLRFKLGVRINVKHVNFELEFVRQGTQGEFHLVTKMAV